MSGFQPLCADLYRRLQTHYGEVTVASPGIAFQARRVPTQGTNGVYNKLVVSEPGEYYRVNCPKCGDSRKRLWVNHRFVEHNELAICYNENCYHDFRSREQLLLQLYMARPKYPPPVRPGKVEPAALGPAEWPGNCVPLVNLPPENLAISYLAERGYDPYDLARRYGLCLCLDSEKFPAVRDRIIIPILMNGMMVGWQARFVGERNWKACPIVKYYDMPRLAKRAVLYNHDTAARQPFAVLQEGVADVWSTGDPAMALLCKTLSYHQRQLLLFGPFRDKPLFVMLDSDARDDADVIVSDLRKESPWRPVVRVDTPSGTDPGDFSHEENMGYIHRAAASAGVDLERIISQGVQHPVPARVPGRPGNRSFQGVPVSAVGPAWGAASG